MFDLLGCVIFLFPLLILASATLHDVFLPPTPPISCDIASSSSSSSCTVQSYQGPWPHGRPCKASVAIFPTSEAELIHAVALASRTGSKVRVVSGGSHSFNKLVCPGGDDGILISTQKYNSHIRVNLTAQTVTADAGVMLKDLIDKIAQDGLALPHTPFYGGVSVAGMISTGAHGSGMWGKGSAPHDYVVGVRLIVAGTEEEGYARVVEVVEGEADLDAARLSLGVLGAISRVTFQLEPMFKRSGRVEMREDEQLEEEVLDFGHRHEFGSLVWYPSQRKVLWKVEDRVPVETPGNGALKIPHLDKMEVRDVRLIYKTYTSIEEGHMDIRELCFESGKTIESRLHFGDGLVNTVGGTFIGYPVVGFNHNMQACNMCDGNENLLSHVTATSIISNPPPMAEEDDYKYPVEDIMAAIDNKAFTCKWNPMLNPFFLHDISISIPISHVKEAILDIKKLRDVHPSSMCKVEFFGGIFMRFTGSSRAYLGERCKAVVLEVFHRVHQGAPEIPMRDGDIIEEIEQMLLSKFEGRPHWGKNRNIAFENMHACTPHMDKFLEARKRFDPRALFSSEWSDVVLGIDNSFLWPHLHQSRPSQISHDHCALQGLCICTKDSHCNPSMGYFCRQGYIYDQARVCRYETRYNCSHMCNST